MARITRGVQKSAAPAPHIPVWATVVPIAFVVLSLVALVLVPILSGARTRALWQEIADVAEPSDFLVDRIEFALAREIAGVRGFLLTGEPGFLDLYAQAVTEELAAYEPLEDMAGQLGPEVVARLEQLRSLTAVWHESANRLAEVEERPGGPEQVEAVTVQRSFYRETLNAVVELDAAIDQAVDQRRAEIRAAERAEFIITGVLALVALASVLVVGGLGRRLYRTTEQAEQRRLEVENLTQRRAGLIRGLGHDLKNPLGAVDSYAEILETGMKGDLRPEQRQIIERIRRATRASLNIINDLVELSRAEAGQLPIRREPIELPAVVSDVTDEYRAELEEAGVELEADLPPTLPTIRSDPDRIRQVLGNLLTNAVKYVPAGQRVTVRVGSRTAAEALPTRHWQVVDVEDTGPGIPPEEQQRIFDEFYRVENAERPSAGSGLGLAISRRIARLMGGDLTVQSEPGAGSTFTFWLPSQAPPAR